MTEEKVMAQEVNEEADFITLQFDDGEDVECEILGLFDFEGAEYIALLPDDGSDDVFFIHRHFHGNRAAKALSNSSVSAGSVKCCGLLNCGSGGGFALYHRLCRGAAGGHAEHHGESKEKCEKFFHWYMLLSSFWVKNCP